MADAQLINILISILTILLVIIISSLPLYLAVSLLGGKVSILRAFLVMIATGIISIIVNIIFPIWGTLVALIILIWVFHEVFRLKWFKAILAWILWLIFVLLFLFIASILGISFVLTSLF